MNCGGFFLTADFLYWRAENHGFSYAYELETTDPVGLNVGSIVRPNPSWDPAFRVGAGWNTNYDFWDVYLNYTWYRNTTSRTSTNTVNGYIPLWPVDTTAAAGIFDTVQASTRFMLNIGDLELGRMVYLTKSVAIRPHWGARGGTIHQKFNSAFSSPLLGGLVSEQTFSGKNNYWGIGPRAGVNGEFHLNQGFSILGKAAAALLYGKNSVRALTQELDVGATAFTIERQYNDSFYQLVPNLQLLLGIQWQTCFWCEKMFYKMSVSWETNFWWDQFNLPFASNAALSPFPTVGNQPLTMEGLTVNFEWDF